MNNEKQKQDCETNAFKRMAVRLKKDYPKLKFIITGDALYATTPMINICHEKKWHYIFNLKQSHLKNVYEQFEDNITDCNEVTKENYFLYQSRQHLPRLNLQQTLRSGLVYVVDQRMEVAFLNQHHMFHVQAI